MKNFIKRIFSIKALAPLVFFSCALPVPALAGVTTPTKFLVTFYRIGFLNTSDGNYFDLFNNPEGVQVDISNTGSATALVSNAPAPPLGKTYNVFYAMTKNIYTQSGASQGCYTKALSVNNDNRNISWLTTNVAESGDLVHTNNAYSTNNYGPLSTTIDGTVTGATSVTSMYQVLVNRANPFVIQNGNIVGNSNADVELFFGQLSNPIDPSSYPRKTFSLGFNLTNALTLECGSNSTVMLTQIKYSLTLD
jgi:hypothetical protein